MRMNVKCILAVLIIANFEEKRRVVQDDHTATIHVWGCGCVLRVDP